MLCMYFRENWLSPRQNSTNRCHILIAETIGNLLTYALDWTFAKARLVGRHFKAEPFWGRFLLSISSYEKVLSVYLLYKTVDIPHNHHWSDTNLREKFPNCPSAVPICWEIQQPFSAHVCNYKEHAWLRKKPEPLCI